MKQFSIQKDRYLQLNATIRFSKDIVILSNSAILYSNEAILQSNGESGSNVRFHEGGVLYECKIMYSKNASRPTCISVNGNGNIVYW